MVVNLTKIFTMLISLFVFCTLSTFVRGYPKGAPEGACETMSPGGPHKFDKGKNYTVSTEESPYRIWLDKTTKIEPGKPIKGRIWKTIPTPFKGFILRAFNAQKKPIGSFKASDETKLVSCVGASALTHADSGSKNEVWFEWTPPEGADFYMFKATVVQSEHVWWEEIKSVKMGKNGLWTMYDDAANSGKAISILLMFVTLSLSYFTII